MSRIELEAVRTAVKAERRKARREALEVMRDVLERERALERWLREHSKGSERRGNGK